MIQIFRKWISRLFKEKNKHSSKGESDLVIGYYLDTWHNYRIAEPIIVDISKAINSNVLICGASGSGKSYFELQLLARLVQMEPDGEFIFADFKGDDSFRFLKDCSNYHSYYNTLDALEYVYERLKKRQSGEDDTRNQITLVIDEYVAFILAEQGKDKKEAGIIMNKVGELLLLGRSMKIRVICTCQRAESAVFTAGARINFCFVIILGSFNKTSYDMLFGEYDPLVKNRVFNRGEGSLQIDGRELIFIKASTIEDFSKIEEICRRGL